MVDLRKRYDKLYPLSGDRFVGVSDTRFSLFSGQWELFSLLAGSPVPVGGVADTDTDLHLDSVNTVDGITTVTWVAKSNLWEKKSYVLTIDGTCAAYKIVLQGKGAPDRIEFFKGDERVFSQYFTSGYMTPQFQDVDHERAKSMGGTEGKLMPLRCAPPPYAFPFWNDYNDDWCGIGIAAPKGQNNYERLIYRPVRHAGFYLDLPLLGYTEINGEWTSPTIWFGFGKDDMDVVAHWSDWTRQTFAFPAYHGIKNAPDWWKMPIFCGWGEQCWRAIVSNQKDYEAMAERIDRLGLRPGTIFIDDGWATGSNLVVNTERWPDLRAFADAQHKKGRRVILWQHVWDRFGFSESNLTKPKTYKQTVDPTNPAFLAELRESIHRALSSDEGCYNCDGFKMDFEDNLPREEAGTEQYDTHVYGLEMMRRLFEAYYKYAKETKPDALINTSAVHPYFSDICDQIRLHDYWGTERCTVAMMKYRTALTRAVMPDVLIDTDHEHTDNVQQALYKSLADSSCGVPCLYTLSCYTDEELLEIKKNWDAYIKTIE